MKNRSRIIMYCGALLCSIVCGYFGKNIPFEKQQPLFESLRTTAAIVFAVIGAWLTVIYPNALQKVFGKAGELPEDDEIAINLMVDNVRISTGIIAFVMIVGVLSLILKQMNFVLLYVNYFRAISFAILGALSFVQFWTLLMTLAQAQLATEAINLEKIRRCVEKRKKSHTSVAEQPKEPK